MFASFDRLDDDLASLRHYSTFLTNAVDVGRLKIRKNLKMAEHVAELQRSHDELSGSADLARLNYSSIVIALYGALERFGEDSVGDYVRFLNRTCPSYGVLPEVLRNKHMELTVSLLQSADIRRFASPERLIDDLNSCLKDEAAFRLTPATFSFHTSNIRHGMLGQMWSRIGVDDVVGAISKNSGYANAVEQVDAGSTNDSFFRFDDIAERRNEIAHGVDISDLLSMDFLQQYIDIVEAFALALRTRVESSMFQVLAEHHGVFHDKPLKVFNNEIVCLECSEGKLAVGDLLIGRSPAGTCHGSQILEIEVDGAPTSEVDSKDGAISVGLKVSFDARENHSFWSLTKDDPIGSFWLKGLPGPLVVVPQ